MDKYFLSNASIPSTSQGLLGNMKNGVSWRKRITRKKIKYMLMSVVVVGVFFVSYQLLYFKELNRVIIDNLIGNTTQLSNKITTKNEHLKWNEPRHSKMIQDADGHAISLRGTRDQDISKYVPNAKKKFVCITSGEEINFIKINDDYCDCPMDGSDEPGTNACNNGVFYCGTSSAAYPAKISSYKVNDGFCDCCDGSDEWKEISVKS
ncbi:uncharacterized protein LOC105703410 isoform X2 [Orussus abietinus]|uniref:uncharacterized protein LOC105703410 isoform X2 n=1 Tax=Orussus abietinus TaxID=222816 RepID=UPI000625016E|nr:uncharacterized protein LOC105703410 isoform X2 [Orussus abietinus]